MYQGFDICTRSPVGFPRHTNDIVAIRDGRNFYRRYRLGGKRAGADAVYHESQVDLPDAQAHEVFRCEGRLKYGLQDLCIERTDTKYDERADIAEHGVTHFFLHLFDVLVGQGEGELVFARFGEDVGECFVHHGLELIDIEVEAREFPHTHVRLICAGYRGEVYLDDEHRAQERSVGLAHATFREIDDKYLLFVHHFTQVERGFGLPHDVADERVRGELADLVLYGGRRLARVRIGEARKFLCPKSFHDRVCYFLDDRGAKDLVGKHAVHIEQGRVRIFKERQERILQDVFHSCAPRIDPDALQGAHEPRDDEVPAVVADIFHHVEPDGVVSIKRSEIHDVFDALVRDKIEELFGGRSVRVDESQSLAVLDVLDRHVLEHGGFAHAGFPDDIDVLAAICRANAEHLALSSCMRRREVRNAAIIILMTGLHTRIVSEKPSRVREYGGLRRPPRRRAASTWVVAV